MRNYDAMLSAIVAAIPRGDEIATLTDAQIQDLRKVGNTFDNVLYMQTREWKEWRAANPPKARAQ